MEIAYLDHDNVIDVQLQADREPVDLSKVTQMDLVFDDVVISSKDYPGVFDWTVGSGLVRIRLYGMQLERRYYDAKLIVYDDSTPHGIVWGVIPILVR